ncbi:unnamed protein product [Urochloa humidicola]
MAVGFAVAGDGEDAGRRYGGGVTAFVALSCVTAAMGGAIFGYDIGTAGGVSSMDPFLRDFFPGVYRRMKGGGAHVSNYCKFDSQLLTLFTSSLYVSGLLTALLLASWVTARRGRRPSMILGGAAYLAGTAVSGGAVSAPMAILGRALLGVGLGFANQAVPLYLSEMAPARYRGMFSNGFQFSLCLGALLATVVNYGSEKIAAAPSPPRCSPPAPSSCRRRPTASFSKAGIAARSGRCCGRSGAPTTQTSTPSSTTSSRPTPPWRERGVRTAQFALGLSE